MENSNCISLNKNISKKLKKPCNRKCQVKYNPDNSWHYLTNTSRNRSVRQVSGAHSTQTLQISLLMYEEFPSNPSSNFQIDATLTFRACTWPSPTRSTQPSYACQSPGTQAAHATDPVGPRHGGEQPTDGPPGGQAVRSSRAPTVTAPEIPTRG